MLLYIARTNQKVVKVIDFCRFFYFSLDLLVPIEGLTLSRTTFTRSNYRQYISCGDKINS